MSVYASRWLGLLVLMAGLIWFTSGCRSAATDEIPPAHDPEGVGAALFAAG